MILLGLVVIWIVCIVSLTIFVRSHENLHLSLGLAYVFSLTFSHLLGALIYLVPSYNPLGDPYLRSKGTTALQTVVGFQMAVEFAITFCLAYSLFVLLSFKAKGKFAINLKSILERAQVKQQLRKKLLGLFRIIFATSFIFYILFFVFKFVNIPSISLLFSQGPVMLISSAMVAEFLFPLGYELYFMIAALALLILFIQGFLGYSIGFMVLMAGILASYKKSKANYFFYGLALIVTGSGVLRAWLTTREVIRTIVFDGGFLSLSVLREFLEKFTEAFFSSFLSGYSSIFVAIDTRINLNNILGRVVTNWVPDIAIDSIKQLYIALIPRLIWSEKPLLESSTNWVSQLTNQSFSEGTSVGLGNIAELYGNFGEPGVLVGAIVIAFVFVVIDYQMNLSLYNMMFLRAWGFLLVGISLIQPGGVFVKIINKAIISIAVFFLLMIFLRAVVPNKFKEGGLKML